MEMFKTFEEKISFAVEKVKALKEEKTGLEEKIKELEISLKQKDLDIEKLTSEKTFIKSQIEDLLNELEPVELN